VSISRLLPGNPPELVVYDKAQRCPYLQNRVARMPLRLPARPLDREELDSRLASGDRRQGFVLYRTSCPACNACEPIRLDVRNWVPSRTQRRIRVRGDREIEMELGPPLIDRARIALYNRHKQKRGLGDGQTSIDADGYREFLVHTCCDTFELSYRIRGQLAGIAIVDRGACSLSAVYCFYDPLYPKLSIGTYSIMKQLELCERWGLCYLYLGLYIASCDRMAYKAAYLPHERLIDGRWARFERPA